MRRISLRWRVARSQVRNVGQVILHAPQGFAMAAIVLCVAAVATPATRPRYGGTLRVEVRESSEAPEPPAAGKLSPLPGGFTVERWEAGRRAVYTADPFAPGGRPFLDTVEIQMGRSLHDQSVALNLGRSDMVEFDPAEAQRSSSRRTWSSSPVRLLVLVFGARVEDPRVREAFALAVDRASIHSVMLQRQGEISGALLPQWISGEAFLFPVATDIARARSLVTGVPASARALSIGVSDPAFRRIADRIALNARDAGLTVSAALPNTPGDVRLIEVRLTSADPAQALAGVASALGLPAPARAETPEGLYAAEKALLDGFRAVPLFHLPDVYSVGSRVKGGPGITPLGEWHFENLWIEGARP
jgi:hypothetical protein